jgi:Na+:H+ antiporter
MALWVLIIAVLLGVGFVGTRVAAVLRLPHSVLLVLLGILGGVVLKWLQAPIAHDWSESFAEIILYVLLPPLIFESSYNINYGDLQRDMLPIAGLSVFGLLLSCALVGWGLHLTVGLALIPACIFGALISATDPVAVVALFREVGVPHRLATLVEGESLLNDGTAIVLFRVMVGLLATGAVTLGVVLQGAVAFVLVAVGGLAIGCVAILVTCLLLGWTSHSAPAQLGLTVATAYVSFIVADHFCHVSGVVATMTVGLYLGNRARLELSRDALHSMHAVWEFLALCANTLVFLAVGLVVDLHILAGTALLLPATLLVVYLARTVSVIATITPLNRLRLCEPISAAYNAIMVWGGLRGGLALALVLTLPQTLVERSELLALATAVVLSTLILNALTTAPLLRSFGLTALTAHEEAFFHRSLHQVLSGVFSALRQATLHGSLSTQLLAEVETHLVAPVLKPGADEHALFDVQQMLLSEQRYYNRQVENGVLSKAAYRHLTTQVVRRQEAFQSHGIAALRDVPLNVDLTPGIWQRWLRGQDTMVELTVTLEILLHLDFALSQVSRDLPSEGPLQELNAAWTRAARSRLDTFYKTYPHMGVAVQGLFIAHTVSATARQSLQTMLEGEVIGDSVYTHALSTVDGLYNTLLQDAQRRLHPTLIDTLREVPLFVALPEAVLTQLAEGARRQRFEAGEAVVREGEKGDSLYVVLSGLLEVHMTLVGEAQDRPRLFAGACIGEIALLSGSLRTATVVAVVVSELAEIPRELFVRVTAEYPALRQRVQRLAEERTAQSRGRPRRPGVASETLYDLLAQVPLFSDLSSVALSEVAQSVQVRQWAAGATVVEEGTAGESFFLVLKGELEVEVATRPRLGVGDFFGELSLLFGRPRSATVRVVVDAELAEMHCQDFETLLKKQPTIQTRVREVAEQRLQEI